MLDGTAREVLELLAERPRSPTEVAEELGVSVQTASRNLKQLAERRYAEETRGGEGRGYKRYRMLEFAQVFAGFDGELFERTLELTGTHRVVLSIMRVPQPEFHPILLSRLFYEEDVDLSVHAEAIVLYGSVARGDATEESDIDLLIVYDPGPDTAEGTQRREVDQSRAGSWWGGPLASGDERVISEEWFTVSEFRDGLDTGSQFLHSALDEGIVLYDPEEVIRGARQESAG